MPEIVEIMFDGIVLKCPVEYARTFNKYTYNSFPTKYCGAGNGFGEKAVPDYIFGPTRFFKYLGLNFLDISIKLSPACFIHDKDWELAEPTWKAFYECNRRFGDNLESIIDSKAKGEFVRARALYRPVTYQNAVDLAGRFIFWSMKYSASPIIPLDAMSFVRRSVYECRD